MAGGGGRAWHPRGETALVEMWTMGAVGALVLVLAIHNHLVSTRMGSLTADRPKALLSVNGRTLIDRQLSALHAHDIYAITIVTG